MQSERDFATQFTQPELVEMGPPLPRQFALPPVPPREQVLNSISHPRLRELVETAYKLARKQVNLPWIRTEFDYLEKGQNKSTDAYDYRKWVWKRLHDSDLAQQLPGGKSTLPDITDAMREPWRSLEKLREPKNYEQLLKHVSRFVDWYIDPTKEVKPPIRQIAVWVLVALLPIAVTLFFKAQAGLKSALGISLDSGMFGLATTFAWFILVGIVNRILYRYGTQVINGRKVSGFHNAKHQIDAAELYYYLAFAYADRPDPDTPAEL